jgi:hypothetical protein
MNMQARYSPNENALSSEGCLKRIGHALITGGKNTWLAIACACFAVTIVLGAMAALPPEPSACLRIPPIYDFGVVRQGTHVKAKFDLENIGRRSVILSQVLSNCACTASQLSARVLAPGQKTPITVEVDVGAARGKMAQAVEVIYQQEGTAQKKYLPLRIHGTVNPDYEVVPQHLVFSRENRRLSVTVSRATFLSSLSVTEAACTHSAFRVSELRKLNRQGDWQVEVTFDPDQWEKRDFDYAELLIHTDATVEKIFRVGLRSVE